MAASVLATSCSKRKLVSSVKLLCTAHPRDSCEGVQHTSNDSLGNSQADCRSCATVLLQLTTQSNSLLVYQLPGPEDESSMILLLDGNLVQNDSVDAGTRADEILLELPGFHR